jgi:hypothetical protein
MFAGDYRTQKAFKSNDLKAFSYSVHLVPVFVFALGFQLWAFSCISLQRAAVFCFGFLALGVKRSAFSVPN